MRDPDHYANHLHTAPPEDPSPLGQWRDTVECEDAVSTIDIDALAEPCPALSHHIEWLVRGYEGLQLAGPGYDHPDARCAWELGMRLHHEDDRAWRERSGR